MLGRNGRRGVSMRPRQIGGVREWVAVACLLCSTAASVAADFSWNVNAAGRIGGCCTAVEVVGRYAYLREGGNLTILDISNPSQPLAVGHFSFGDFYVGDIQVKDGLAYMAGGTLAGQYGLQIVDVRNPRSPRVRGFYLSYSPVLGAGGVCVTDGLAYVSFGYGGGDNPQGGFEIIDVSDPSSPALRSSFIEAGFVAMRIDVSAGIGYVAALNGLHIFDVRNPSLPRRLAFYSQYYCMDILVSGALAYTATDGGLEIVDVTSPTAPARRSRLPGLQFLGLCFSDRLVFVAQAGYVQGLGIVDVTNPSSPTLLGRFSRSQPTGTPSGFAWAVAVSSGTAYLANGGWGLTILDVTKPSSPTLRASYETLSDAGDVYLGGGVAYVANGLRGLKTVDVSNPASPKVLGSVALPGAATKVTVSGKRAYICDNSGTTPETWRSFLHIVDVAMPSSPRLLGFYIAPEAWDVAVSGNWAYVANNDGFQVVDVSNPSSPTLRGSFATPGWPGGVSVSGGLAFVADYSTLQIIDVRNPAAPFLRSSFPASPIYRIRNVFVASGVAYTDGVWNASGTPGDFACIDVRNPDAPKLLGVYDIAGEFDTGEFYVSNGLAYVVLDMLRVLDVRKPSAPTLCGSYPVGVGSFKPGVFASGDLVYLADSLGLRIYQFTGTVTSARSWQLYR